MCSNRSNHIDGFTSCPAPSTIRRMKKPPIGVEVGQRIGALRVAQGMTQAALGRQMGAVLGREVKPLIVTRIEGGKRPLVIDEAVAIAAVLGVDPAELLRAADAPLPPMGLQRAQTEYAAAVDALKTSDAARRAAIERWTAAQAALRAAYDAAGASDSAKFLAGCDDNIAEYLGGDA